jgi:hypothetical protein
VAVPKIQVLVHIHPVAVVQVAVEMQMQIGQVQVQLVQPTQEAAEVLVQVLVAVVQAVQALLCLDTSFNNLIEIIYYELL